MPIVDKTLFDQARQGDRDAFWRLVLPYRGLIFSVALGMLKNRERAEDELHNVLLQAFRSISSVKDPSKFSSWLYSMTRNHVSDQLRREQRFRKALDTASHEPARVTPISELREKEEWLNRMERAIEGLPEPFRVILAMKYMNNDSCADIAGILDISVTAVKSRLFQARKLLRKQMNALANEEGTHSHELR